MAYLNIVWICITKHTEVGRPSQKVLEDFQCWPIVLITILGAKGRHIGDGKLARVGSILSE